MAWCPHCNQKVEFVVGSSIVYRTYDLYLDKGQIMFDDYSDVEEDNFRYFASCGCELSEKEAYDLLKQLEREKGGDEI